MAISDQSSGNQADKKNKMQIDNNNLLLNISYLKAQDVNLKQLKYIQVKQIFATKLAHLKQMGQ